MTSASSLPPPDFRPVAAFPEIASIEAAAQSGDWPALRSFADRASDTDDLNFVVNTVAEVPGVEQMLAKALEEDDSTLPNVMLGARHITLAWEARSAYRAKYVSDEQWRMFRWHLVQSEGLLIEVTAHEPDNAVAWKHRLTTARGLSLGLSEAQRRYAQLAKHHPHFYAAQGNFLQELCPKWAGSWELMFAFARERVAAAPEGGLHGSLIAEAHLERATELPDGEEVTYLRQPDVVAELAAAAAKSVLHPAFEKPYGWVTAHSHFAMCFSLAGDYARAAAHFRAMGHLGAKAYWGYLGGGVEEENFCKHRAIALAKG